MSKAKKYRGYYCWMCDRMRPNEQFSRKGRFRHICRRCMNKPLEVRERIQANRDIYQYWDQKNISDKNIARLEELCEFPDPKIRQRAKLVLEVARVKPTRKKRVGYLRFNHPELFEKLVQHEFYFEWTDDPEPEYYYMTQEQEDQWALDHNIDVEGKCPLQDGDMDGHDIPF